MGFYRSKGWDASSTFIGHGAQLASRLTLRPDAIAKRDGSEHLVYAIGSVKEASFKLFKQVLYDIECDREFCHVVVVCTEKISQIHERVLKSMGIGVLLIRRNADP